MFYTFMQNNSGGYFIQNEDVDTYVIIEGDNALDIINKAKEIFDGNDDYCECCGERWDIEYFDVEDIIRHVTDEPMVYGVNAYKYDRPTFESDKLIIHYLNGRKETVDIGLNKKEKDKDKYNFRLTRYVDTNSWGFEYGKSSLKLPSEIEIEHIRGTAKATKNGSTVMVIPYIKGIKVTYKNNTIDIIPSETKTKKAYDIIMEFINDVDNINC